ncbi:acyl-peptide hydrolase [Acrocarpospora phusangensis]|uniref:Acyl-peptide hydrolase n=1 Tax=Acrocarpospora phusangensis TaxID=1070424 RepID=A0A919QHR2_9ACTN|nr:prolyl oligopeptidase family serine peptidase [Acrocarpospora phusangensis]GIH26650.1 acyl-peptide hydrolase [Acrocarpospora phusangensis]
MPPERTPISTSDVARSGLRLGYPTVLGDEVWWEEDRPAEAGRRTIVHRAAGGARRELLGAPWDARSRVHEYGGRSYVVVPGAGVAFVNNADQRLYLTHGGTPRPLTAASSYRYGDLLWGGGAIWCVREHHDGDDGKVHRALVSVTLDGEVREVVSGSDFYASPALSPDGEHLAYICWNHPRLPWTGTELRITRLEDGSSWTVKGGMSESVLAPQWRDNRNLYLVSDWSGWWNLYQIGIFGTSSQALYPAEEEFAWPLWELGGAPYLVLGDGRLAVLHGQGDLRLGVLDPETGTLTDLDVPYTGWRPALSADGTTLAGIAYGSDIPRSVVRVDTVTGRVEGLRRDIAELPDVAYLPEPHAVEISGSFGRRVHAYRYAPYAAEGPAPYVVFLHGGPTGHATTELSLEKAFFTTRGIGVLDVNYGGSTGYGRAYRERLRGQWGVVDVEDTVAAAQWLAAEGYADPARIAVRGASAGGWTVMAACASSTVFRGGVSIAGISALAPLAAATHDFESRYVEWLVGPESLYPSREPLSRAGEVSCPMLLMQGLADPVVPPSQSEAFATALTDRGIPCTYLSFEGESHGFRRLETKTAALAAELAFYEQLFRPDPSD